MHMKGFKVFMLITNMERRGALKTACLLAERGAGATHPQVQYYVRKKFCEKLNRVSRLFYYQNIDVASKPSSLIRSQTTVRVCVFVLHGNC